MTIRIERLVQQADQQRRYILAARGVLGQFLQNVDVPKLRIAGGILEELAQFIDDHQHAVVANVPRGPAGRRQRTDDPPRVERASSRRIGQFASELAADRFQLLVAARVQGAQDALGQTLGSRCAASRDQNRQEPLAAILTNAQI